MNKYNKHNKYLVIITMFLILAFTGCNESQAAELKILIDGKDYTQLAQPIIRDDRTLVPIRFITENLGGDVEWDESNRRVFAKMGERSIGLVIDSQIVKYDDLDYEVIDTKPIIHNNLTYVPIRIMGEAFNIGIKYNEATKTVEINSQNSSNRNKYYDLDILSIKNNQIINGRTNITYKIGGNIKNDTSYIRLLVLDPNNHTGHVAFQSKLIDDMIEFLPYTEHNGEKILVLAAYDANNKLLAASAEKVIIDVNPQISILELENNNEFRNQLKLTPQTNFSLLKVEYVLTNITTGKIKTLDNFDPYGTTTWAPNYNEKGDYLITVNAYDLNSNIVASKDYDISIGVDKSLSLTGVKENSIVNKPITLNAVRNFDCIETQYVLRAPNTNTEKILTTIPYGSFKYIPSPSDSGEKELLVRVKDTSGKQINSKPIKVVIDGKPSLYLNGIGPNEVVLSNGKSINVLSNVKVSDVKFVFINSEKNIKKIITANNFESQFKPLANETGNWYVYATANYNGNLIESEKINFKVYTGNVYGPYSITEKNNYINFVTNLAKNSNNKLISQSFKIAQSILETGWGQSVPSDKYSGQKSNNLFGIKSKNNEPYIISTTWEVYNGVRYVVDAKFKKYTSPQQSWDDHIKFLLDNDRYNPFEDVMNDPYKAAWAIRRSGYATDPLYSLKIIDLIHRYNLDEFDKKIF
ncbi:hypothetical protein E4100_04120 [Soehngenia longivitae]|uniref:Mannosyl-glycoprotein endo-beta-N-acetylglucosamidase-like domain-containing protein n=1 Tax=Soehngenia longivitae TaxID=2562294 RepID=A0A4Z0D798_9FIRM|nr:glucosaminidase domain-containing protein [Soehngenia longivitae]TFZ40750.1 hypothetical protein E4100_04120 [Soehngenia longivitae]